MEGDVEHPVKRVLDAPVAADGLGQLLGRERPGGDEVAVLPAATVFEFGSGLDLGEGGDPGEAVLAGEAALAVEPVDVARDEDAAVLDAAVALVEIDFGVDRSGWGVGEEALDLLAQTGLVGLDRQEIVGAVLDDLAGD